MSDFNKNMYLILKISINSLFSVLSRKIKFFYPALILPSRIWRKITLLILCCFMIDGHAQVLQILDKSDLQPVSAVFVFNTDRNIYLYSDNKGNVDITNFREYDTLFFRHVAFQPAGFTKADLVKTGLKMYLVDNIIKLDEIVLSATKSPEIKKEIPNKIDLITSKEINFENPQTAADMLQQSGYIFVQQSQMGGGSPVLNGFEANRVLLVIDNVRMNNAIYRSGHLQSVITIDPAMLDKTEIAYGPGSVIYGSDAIGGVMHFYSANPVFSIYDKPMIRTSGFARYSSVNNEKAFHVSFNAGFHKWASLTSLSYKNLGDLRTGKNSNPFYGQWGQCRYYAERINGMDSMFVNNDTTLQKNTGYSQYDMMEKLLFRPNAHSTFVVNLQLSNSSDIPRYDRLSQIDSKTQKLTYAEWYYGPQLRILASLNGEFRKELGIYDMANLVIAWQNISEDRISRKFGNPSREHREETVNAISLNADLKKSYLRKNEFIYGLEVILNKVESVAYAENVDNGTISHNISSRYPDDGSTMNTYSAYAANNWKINKKLVFSQGARFSFITLDALYTDTMMKIMKFPFNKEIKQNNSSLSASLGLVYLPGNNWKISLMGSSGFRVPNVDDLTKVNDSKSKSRLLIVPNPGLKPEKVYHADLTLEKTFAEKVNISLTGYYSFMKNAIVTRPFKFNAQDSIIFDGVLCAVQANINANEACIYGFQAGMTAQVLPSFSIQSNLTYTYGRVKTDNSPFSSIPPVYGITSFKLELHKFKGEFYIRYNGWKKITDYSPAGEDNVEFATVNGNPSWYTLNFRTSYQLNQYLNLQFSVENILDRLYRFFASGVSAPGRNFVIALRAYF